MSAATSTTTSGHERLDSLLSFESVIQLNDGLSIPALGLGTYEATGNECSNALKIGYRLFDTATCYDNEDSVGKTLKAALKDAGISREEVIITTKLWEPDHGRQNTIKSFMNSLKSLEVDYIDLYLIHSPAGGKILETWDAILDLQRQGLIKSVGVSNFNIHHLENLLKYRPDKKPAVNQIELSPYCTRKELVSYCWNENIVVQAYSPLTKGHKLQDMNLLTLAKKYNKTAAQMLIRWSLQCGFVCIPKTVKEERMVENADVFDFSISQQDMEHMNAWNEDLVTDWPGVDILSTPWLP